MHEYSFFLRFNRVTVFDIYHSWYGTVTCAAVLLNLAKELNLNWFIIFMDFRNKEIYDWVF